MSYNVDLVKIDFKNGSSGKTPLNRTNLNQMQQNTQNALNTLSDFASEGDAQIGLTVQKLQKDTTENINDLLQVKNFIENSMKTLETSGTSIHVNDSADYPCKLEIEGKSGQQQNEVDYPEITMTLDSESGNYYLDGVTTQNGTPSPDNVVDFVDTYPAGTYQTTINDKTYVITLSDDLRSVETTSDRLWLDITNAKAWIDKKVYTTIFDNPQGWSQFRENVYTCMWSIPDYGIDITKHSSFARCNYFEEIPNSELGTNIGMYTLNSAYLRVSYPGKTLEEFKEWITEKNESGKPLMAIFTLRFPVENLIQQTCYEWNVPSPNNKIDIENVSGDLEVKAIGENIFDSSLLMQIAGYNTYDEETGMYTTSSSLYNNRSIFYSAIGYQTDRDITKIIDIPNHLNGKTVTIKIFNFINNSELSANNNLNCGFYDNAGKYITHYNTPNISNNGENIVATFTVPNQKCYLDIRRPGAEGTVSFSKIQIIEGSYTAETMPVFEEYKEQTVTFPFAEGQKLYKDGYLASDGIHNKRTQVVLDGTETWTLYSSSLNALRYSIYITISDMYISAGGLDDVHSNYFIGDGSSESTEEFANKFTIRRANGSNKVYFFIPKDFFEATTANEIIAEWKAYLAEQNTAGTPVILEYPLAEEETTAYTSEQQTAYNNLQKLKTYRTVTNISNNQDTNMQLTYKMDLQTQFQELETMLLESGV